MFTQFANALLYMLQLHQSKHSSFENDMFNFLSVGVLFPIEVVTGYLYYLSLASVGGGDAGRDGQGDKWTGPLKRIVGPLTKTIINANKNVAKDIAKGGSCDEYCRDESFRKKES